MRKSSMRKTRNTIAGAVMGLCLATGALAAGGDVKYASPEAAFEQGIGAYRSGYYEIAIPAFLTMILMPFTYSITAGIGAGFIVYVVLKVAVGKAKLVHPLMWVAAALFVAYFSLGPIKDAIGI